MRDFCTYFDKNYLIKGLALYRSIERTCADFKLWILCLDNDTYEILGKLNLDKTVLIKLSELENADPKLFFTKNTRTIVEYYWTMTPCLPLYILKKNPSSEMIAYLDADLYFFNSPEAIYEEFSDKSTLIIPHRFAEKDKMQWEKVSGIFNVGMLIFRNNIEGRKCLEWWREKCLESCTINSEKESCGDQKYLEEFSTKFSGVYILTHKGSNTATWNIKNYRITKKDGEIFIDNDKLIFFHFASFKLYPQSKYSFFDYGTPPAAFPYSKISNASRFIYRPYAKALYNALDEVKKIVPNFNNGIAKRPTFFGQTRQFVILYLNKVVRVIRKIV